jgi:hypothetical protein
MVVAGPRSGKSRTQRPDDPFVWREFASLNGGEFRSSLSLHSLKQQLRQNIAVRQAPGHLEAVQLDDSGTALLRFAGVKEIVLGQSGPGHRRQTCRALGFSSPGSTGRIRNGTQHKTKEHRFHEL